MTEPGLHQNPDEFSDVYSNVGPQVQRMTPVLVTREQALFRVVHCAQAMSVCALPFIQRETEVWQDLLDNVRRTRTFPLRP
jgi:hypothetical protein